MGKTKFDLLKNRKYDKKIAIRSSIYMISSKKENTILIKIKGTNSFIRLIF